MTDNMVLYVQTFEDLMRLKERLLVPAYYHFVSGERVYQYDRPRNRVWRNTDQSVLRDRVKHLPMVWCPFLEGRIEMYYRTDYDTLRKALEQWK